MNNTMSDTTLILEQLTRAQMGSAEQRGLMGGAILAPPSDLENHAT